MSLSGEPDDKICWLWEGKEIVSILHLAPKRLRDFLPAPRNLHLHHHHYQLYLHPNILVWDFLIPFLELMRSLKKLLRKKRRRQWRWRKVDKRRRVWKRKSVKEEEWNHQDHQSHHHGIGLHDNRHDPFLHPGEKSMKRRMMMRRMVLGLQCWCSWKYIVPQQQRKVTRNYSRHCDNFWGRVRKGRRREDEMRGEEKGWEWVRRREGQGERGEGEGNGRGGGVRGTYLKK
jgi:hypothetical protein